MPTNVEIKARVIDAAALFAKARAIADHGPVEIIQDDAFFACATGRLKLRTLSASAGQLIFYQRADAAGPKESRYTIVPTSTPELLRATLTAALGLTGRVRKRRLLFMLGATRIHLDDVADLGHFLELEVVLRDGETVDQGIATAHAIMERLGVAAKDLVDRAYVDLL
jgi:adenylate cyclase class IV